MACSPQDKVILVGGGQATKDLDQFLTYVAPALVQAVDSPGTAGTYTISALGAVWVCTATDTWVQVVPAADPPSAMRLLTVAPADPMAANSPGNPGEVWLAATHMYTCIAANTWLRFAITAW
jgi:hypothetical protein